MPAPLPVHAEERRDEPFLRRAQLNRQSTQIGQKVPDKRVRFGQQEYIRQRLQSHLVRDVRFFRVQLRPPFDEFRRFVYRPIHFDVHKLKLVRRRRALYFSQQRVVVRRQEDSIDAVFFR